MQVPHNTVQTTANPRLDENTFCGTKQKKRKEKQSPRCLVIDDNRDVLQAVAAMLPRLGYQVDTAETKAEVFRMVFNRYDLILTDLEMPDMNGYHLAVTIKTERKKAKVIIMTGRHPSDCMAMMSTGWVDEWIFKPFGLDELRWAIQASGSVNHFSDLTGEHV